jgi:dihydroorotate dehydrogenase (fumarate)
LNGHTEGGWIEFAKQIRQTGVDALELNIYSVPEATSWEQVVTELP